MATKMETKTEVAPTVTLHYTYSRSLVDAATGVAVGAYSGSKGLALKVLPESAAKAFESAEATYVKPVAVRVEETVGSLADRADASVVDPVLSYSVNKAESTKVAVTEAVQKTVADVAAKPIVKDMISPATAAVVGGIIEASDVVVNYTLPEEKEEEEEVKVAGDLVVPRAMALSRKVRRRLSKRLTASLEARKEAVVHTDLFQYSKNFLDTQVVPLIPDELSATWEESEGAIATERVTKLAKAVLATYSARMNGVVQPYIVAVSTYGEHFMERVHQYEMPEEGKEEQMDAMTQGFIERISGRFIEPTLVRVVAVFLVLGDEVRRFRIKKLEPALMGAWEKMDYKAAGQQARVIYDAVIRKTTDMASSVQNNMDGFYKSAVEEYMSLDTDGDGHVSYAEFQAGMQKRMGDKYSDTLAPLVKKAFHAAKQTKVARALLSVQTSFTDLKAAAYAEWTQLDTDGDNQVSFAEFKTGVQKRLGDAWTQEMIPVLQKMHLASRDAAAEASTDAEDGGDFVDAEEA